MQKNVLSHPSRHILSQHPHSHPSEWAPRGHQGCQNRQHSKNGWKLHKLHKSSRPSPIQTLWSRDPGTLFRLKIKKNKRFMIFDPKKRGSFFSTFSTPPSFKTSKKWVSSGGVWGGSGPKTHWGMRLLDKIMILQGVKLTIQPLRVGYAHRPNKAKMGGYVAFSPICACLALI